MANGGWCSVATWGVIIGLATAVLSCTPSKTVPSYPLRGGTASSSVAKTSDEPKRSEKQKGETKNKETPRKYRTQ